MSFLRDFLIYKFNMVYLTWFHTHSMRLIAKLFGVAEFQVFSGVLENQ